MKFPITILLLFGLFSSCKQSKHSLQAKIINDIFLQVVDTVAYNYNTLRPPSNDTLSQKVFKDISITVYDVLDDIHTWDKSIITDLDDKSLINLYQYKKLYQSSWHDTLSTPLDISKIDNIGRYKLVANHNPDIRKKEDFAGHIKFSRILYNDKVGLGVVTIQDNIKSGIVKLVYLKKEVDTWSVVKESTLEIW